MKEMKIAEFVRRMKGSVESSLDSRFTLFLGAGASYSSGVPMAGGLVKRWLPRLKNIETGNDNDLQIWAANRFKGYNENNPAEFYGPIMEALFINPKDRQQEIENLIERKDPHFGYAVLAQLISHEEWGKHFNMVLTTNFDDMVADALYLYTNKKPLVIAHESLVSFVQITRSRPLVIKLHGDARLAPKNTEFETAELAEEVKRVVMNILTETGLIFAGYGGNDQSILDILKDIPDSGLPWGIYWVNDHPPTGELGEWLDSRGAIWVNHLDFDEWMLIVHNEFVLPQPNMNRFKKINTTYFETFKTLTEEINSRPETDDKHILQEAAAKAAKEFDSWVAVELEARKYKESEPDKANEIYQKELENFPNSAPLLGAYSHFLHFIRKEFVHVEEYYLRALQIDPEHAQSLGNYAVFLEDISKDYDKAEKHYQRVLELAPDDADFLGNYAAFLYKIRKDFDKGEDYFQHALQADPEHTDNLGNYAGFKLSQGDQQKGIEILNKAFQFADPEINIDLLLECWFYQYAHIGEDSQRKESLTKIKELLESEVRSPGWDLSQNVQRGIEDGHPARKSVV